MRIIYASTTWIKTILSLDHAVSNLELEATWFSTDSFFVTNGYWEKKKYEAGFHAKCEKWKKKRFQELIEEIKRFKPDKLLFFNFPEYLFTTDQLRTIQKLAPVYVSFIDNVFNWNAIHPYVPLIDRIAVFDPKDMAFIEKQWGIISFFSPSSYDSVYLNVGGEDSEALPQYDIVLVGSPYKNRLAMMRKLADYATKKKRRLKLIGPFWDKQYFWKKYTFALKRRNLVPYVQNVILLPAEVAKIYCQSRIAINIHTPGMHGVNIRTFNIMAAGALSMLDEREDYLGLVHPGEDVVVYKDADELIEKIDYYLEHEEERKRIAARGRETIKSIPTQEETLLKFLTT